MMSHSTKWNDECRNQTISFRNLYSAFHKLLGNVIAKLGYTCNVQIYLVRLGYEQSSRNFLSRSKILFLKPPQLEAVARFV